jgi:hypothetical protein
MGRTLYENNATTLGVDITMLISIEYQCIQ